MPSSSGVSIHAGTQIGPYRIQEKLGAGGMGEVYRALDTRLNRPVAIKFLSPELKDDGANLRFRREAETASSLNHPHILTVYDAGEFEDRPYLVTEFVDGGTLEQWARSGSPSWQQTLELLVGVADGLACAHEAGILHRDVKPANILLTKSGYAKLADFGLAKLAPQDPQASLRTLTAELTRPGVIMGTLAYLSPEQAAGQPGDARSDVFAFGVVLYEVLTGRRPFQGANELQLLHAVINQPAPSLAEVRPELPAALCAAVARALAKEPAQRYPGMRDLVLDLRRLLHPSAEATGVQAASPAAGASTPRNLPVPRTPFVGREAELAALRPLLLDPAIRLLTLTGAGGTGKTRLAARAAMDLAGHFTGGIFFVNLASLSDPSLVVSAIAQALEIREIPGRPLLEPVQEHLAGLGQVLLVLDDFERVSAASPLIVDLLDGCRGLKVMVTSRVVLRVYGEQEFSVSPLPLPDARGAASLDELLGFASVALFVSRAAAVKPGFRLNPQNAQAVAEICQRLDGLPLAIELAAARVKLLSPAGLLARIASRLELLTGGARDLPERQQTLRGTIDWSYELLTRGEQKLFRRLSVFFGGCTLEAAEAVCNTQADLDFDVLDGVASLMDKSLLSQTDAEGAEPRLTMLETIREYGLERLAAAGELEATRLAHAAYCLVLAEEGNQQLAASEKETWLRRCDLELENFRAALDCLFAARNAQWALRLAVALYQFWERRELISEGRSRLEAILRMASPTVSPKAWSKAAAYAGFFALVQGDFASALALHREALNVYRQAGDAIGIVSQLNAMGAAERLRGDYEAARLRLEESLRACRELGDRSEVAAVLSNLAEVVRAQGQHGQARKFLEEALAIFRELQDPIGVAWTLNYLGDLARDTGGFDQARRLYQQGMEIFEAHHDLWGCGRSFADLGYLALDEGDLAAAHGLYGKALKIFLELAHKRGIANALEGLACLAVRREQAGRALRLAAAAVSLRRTIGAAAGQAEQVRLEQILEQARQQLGPEAAEQDWNQGLRMRLEDAIAYAMES